MLARVILGAIAGYGVYLIATAISVSGFAGGISVFHDAMAFEWGSFRPNFTIPTLLGGLAGYCWHVLTSGRND